jgi:hypothetical protein
VHHVSDWTPVTETVLDQLSAAVQEARVAYNLASRALQRAEAAFSEARASWQAEQPPARPRPRRFVPKQKPITVRLK